MQTLLTGKPYVPAVATDIRATFERVRQELAQAQAASKQADAAIVQMRRK